MRSVAAAVYFCAISFFLFGCATSDPLGDLGAGAGKPDEEAICLLNNCSSDDHCGSCPDGATKCLLSENRCVACDRETGEGCGEGEECSPYGKCVPTGTTCATDGHGTPTITCAADNDCAACDPQHQVCDTATKRCIACTPENVLHCQSTDACVDGKCMPKCPESCDTDAACANCGSNGKSAPACLAHKCAECSPTHACPAGQLCTPQGRCKLACGITDNGKCNSDADCVGCQNAPTCKKPINGGEGTCMPYATGCSDLGKSVAVLPAPYDQVTNTCSNDTDCANVGVTLNVGKMLRDLTGFDAIDDANITYGMNRCASLELNNTSCGVCVPCKQDSDCKPIDIDAFALDAFGPLGGLAAAFLLDQVFGNNPHKIYMYCEKVAGDYGACLPCASWLNSCGVGDYNGGGSCGHNECQVGAALNTSCSTCAQKVCNVDPFCCSKEWDSVCVQEAASVCGASCGNTGGLCSHDECSTGSKLTASCSSCATSVCNFDPYCCNNNWDAMCVQYVAQHCSGKTCGSGGSGSCSHDECSAGGKLTSGCSSCASVVCNVDPYCCSTNWDDTCVQEAAQYCNKCESSGSGSCAHDVCSSGAALNSSCSACAAAVCNADSYCCNNTWDDQCVDEAEYYCNTNCGSSGTGGTCSHDECVQGGVLQMGCSSCVNTVCGSDSYCCDTQWDTQCVEQAVAWCGLSCGSGGGTYCAHSECSSGAALSESCSSCAATVCSEDPYCCSTAWDWSCVDLVNNYCSMSCI